MDESILFFFRDFSLKILSRSSLYFVGIRGIYTGVRKECEESVFPKQSGLVTWPCNLTKWPVWTFCPILLQLAWRFSFSACFTRVHHLAACQSRVPASVHILKHFFTLSHTLPLHDSHLNARFLSAELQANWHGIKPTKWLIKFNLTIATEEITKLLTSILILILLSTYEGKHI